MDLIIPNFYFLLNMVVGTIMLIFTIVIYTGSSSSETRVYSLHALLSALWAYWMGLHFAVNPANRALLEYSFHYSSWEGLLIFASFFYFTYIYESTTATPERRRLVRIALYVFLAGTAVIFLAPGKLLIEGITNGATPLYDRDPIFGPLYYPLFNVPWLALIAGGHVLLAARIRRTADPAIRRRLIYVFISSFLLYLPTGLFAVIFPAAQNFDYAPYAPVASLIWVVFTSYAIFRHKILHIKILVPVVLVLAMASILFLNIFVA